MQKSNVKSENKAVNERAVIRSTSTFPQPRLKDSSPNTMTMYTFHQSQKYYESRTTSTSISSFDTSAPTSPSPLLSAEGPAASYPLISSSSSSSEIVITRLLGDESGDEEGGDDDDSRSCIGGDDGGVDNEGELGTNGLGRLCAFLMERCEGLKKPHFGHTYSVSSDALNSRS